MRHKRSVQGLVGAALVLIATMLAWPAPARVAAVDPTFDAAQMTYEAARVQATIKARATAEAQWATRAAIQQTAAAAAIQQTQVAAEQTRTAQETRAALEAQATRQALELTATAQHYEQSVNATQTAVAINVTRQACEAEATRNVMAALATRQTLDEQAAAEQRQRAENSLMVIGSIVLIVFGIALSIAVGASQGKRAASTRSDSVDAPASAPPACPELLVVDVPRTRLIYGDAADQGARAIAQWLELEEDFDEDSPETNPTGS